MLPIESAGHFAMVLILAGVAPIKNRSFSTSTRTSSAERLSRTLPVMRIGSQFREDPCILRNVQKLNAIANATTKSAVTQRTQLSSSATTNLGDSKLLYAIFRRQDASEPYTIAVINQNDFALSNYRIVHKKI